MAESLSMAAQLTVVSAAALQAMMPNEVSNGHLDILPEIQSGAVSTRLVVKGTLPSGVDWQFPLDLDMQAIYYAEDGAWLTSTELARELRKACDAFKAMVALDRSVSPLTLGPEWVSNVNIPEDRVYGIDMNAVRKILPEDSIDFKALQERFDSDTKAMESKLDAWLFSE